MEIDNLVLFTGADGTGENAESVQAKISSLDEYFAGEQIDMTGLRTALIDIRKSLAKTPHLVQELLPEDLGHMLEAWCKSRDIILIADTKGSIGKVKKADLMSGDFEIGSDF